MACLLGGQFPGYGCDNRFLCTNTCVPASCRSNNDCGDGACVIYRGVCQGILGLTCSVPNSDSCLANDSLCEGGDECSMNEDGVWNCSDLVLCELPPLPSYSSR